MKRKMSLFSLIMLTLSAIIGSGWLFGAGMAAQIAGPASILSWILGAIVIGLIALNYIELGTMFPTSGGMSQYAAFFTWPVTGVRCRLVELVVTLDDYSDRSRGSGTVYEFMALELG